MNAMKLISIGVALVGIIAASAPAQQVPGADSSDLRYYDGWPGAWHRMNGGRIDSLPTFVVRKGPGNSFLEDWHLVIDGKRSPSFGLRSWDPDTKTWRLIWVADPAHFQIWDGVKHADGWYVTRRFGAGRDAFLSRQAWIPQGSDRLLRTIERSTDAGRTWTIRYREQFQRVRP
jgi:hypothetical protein